MDSFEVNKILGAVLGTALAVFGLKELSGIVYHAETPDKPGFFIETAEAETPDAGGGETVAVSIGTLLKTADVAKGEAAAKACGACHNFEEGGPNKTGPNLWDVVERAPGMHEGFAYSEAMKAKSGEKWTYEALNTFITNPKAYVKGTKMSYGGLKKDADRANLIAYLGSLSKTPKPYPGP
jgi:cytochrome c